MSNHVYNDKGQCRLCRRKRDSKAHRRTRVWIASSLRLGVRLYAYPLSYRVCQLQRAPWNGGYNHQNVWMERQRFPRTRNKWIDQELDCAVAMFQRHVWAFEKRCQIERFVHGYPMNGSYGSKVWNKVLKVLHGRCTSI